MNDFSITDPSEIQSLHASTSVVSPYIKPFYGTTTLAFIFQGGLVVAVDSRATAGNYIASQTVNKVIPVNSHLLATMAGGAADCMYWSRIMGLHCKNHLLTHEYRISTGAAAMYLSNCIYAYKGQGLSIGTMVCGYDDKPHIFYVDNSGKKLEGNLFSVGSGSVIAYGILNSEYRFEMQKEEALLLARNAIFHAGHRDAYSGGYVNLYFMDKDGYTKIGSYDFNDLHDEIMGGR